MQVAIPYLEKAGLRIDQIDPDYLAKIAEVLERKYRDAFSD
jgi:hypothetical protein